MYGDGGSYIIKLSIIYMLVSASFMHLLNFLISFDIYRQLDRKSFDEIIEPIILEN